MERRLSAILAADMVGYSRLMEADESGTIDRQKVHRLELIDPAFEKFHGRVVKEMGDGVLVEFPSVVNAVGCAVAIQRAMPQREANVQENRRIRYRIGINLGDVLVEDGDLLGDGVNVASRLEQMAEPEAVYISGTAYDQIEGRSEFSCTFLGEQKLKNISRPIRVYAVFVPGHISGSSVQTSLPIHDRPSIAVLPFDNMSGDPDQEYFADGVVDEIVTGLSRIKWLFVIARNSSFVYKGKSVDVRQVGRELGVRYILEGGIRKAGNRIRVTVQLVESESGAHIWADKYDGALEDVFELQDQITDQIVGIVEPNLQRSEIERSRRKRPENLEAYDLFLRSLTHVVAHMPSDAMKALPLLEKALELEPGYPAVLAYLSWCHELRFTRAGFHESDKKAAMRHARATIASGTDDATALAVAGFAMTALVKNGSGEHEAALSAIDRALSINPSCATAAYLGAQAHACAGHPETAIALANRALRLSPFDPLAFEAHMALGNSAILDDRYEEAAACYGKAAQANANFSTAYYFQGIALALADRSDEAQQYLLRGAEIEPGFSVRLFFEYGFAQALSEKLVRGARLLNLPEQ